MADEAGDFKARLEKLAELERQLQQGEVPMLRCDKTEGFDDLPFLLVNGARYESCLPGTVHAQKGLEPAFSLDKACEMSPNHIPPNYIPPNHIHIKIPGRKAVCFAEISDAETIGTLTEKVAESLGVDRQNWGFYAAGPRAQLEFLPNSARLCDIRIDHDRNLHFLPKTAIR